MKSAASASEERTPGHILMRGGGATADRIIKICREPWTLSEAWSCLWNSRKAPRDGLPLTLHSQPPHCMLEERASPQDSPYMGQLMSLAEQETPHCIAESLGL